MNERAGLKAKPIAILARRSLNDKEPKEEEEEEYKQTLTAGKQARNQETKPAFSR